MSASTSPIVYSVHFYGHDEALIQRLGSVVGSCLADGRTALLIMTREHRDQLCRFLSKRSTDPYQFQRAGKLHILDAQETLDSFVVDDLPSPALFEETVGRLARDLVIASEGLTAFGEMVALLWAQGNKRGALELEDLWNRLLDQSTFHLHCAYPKVLFAGDENDLRDVCDHHSLLIGLGSA